MRLLIIGCGSIGKRHARNARQLADVRLYDVSYQQAKKVAKTLSLELFTDIKDAWQWQPDLAIIASPHITHIPLATAAVLAGSDVLVEKPLSHNYEGVEQLLALAKQHKKNIFVCCNMRFHPGIKALRRNLWRVGKVLFARAHCGEYLPTMRPGRDYRELYAAHREAGGGVILDAIHEIDYLMWLFGEVAQVSCVANKLSNLEIDVEDYASISLTHITGVPTHIHLDYLQRFRQRGCEIAGAEGTLVWQNSGKYPEKCEVKFFSHLTKGWQQLYYNENMDSNQPYVDMLDEVLQINTQDSDMLASGACGAKALCVALRALKSAKTGLVAKESV